VPALYSSSGPQPAGLFIPCYIAARASHVSACLSAVPADCCARTCCPGSPQQKAAAAEAAVQVQQQGRVPGIAQLAAAAGVTVTAAERALQATHLQVSAPELVFGGVQQQLLQYTCYWLSPPGTGAQLYDQALLFERRSASTECVPLHPCWACIEGIQEYTDTNTCRLCCLMMSVPGGARRCRAFEEMVVC